MEFCDAGKHKKEIKKLYKTAFPRNERAPLPLLFKRTNNGRDSFYAVLENGEFLGLVYTIAAEKMVYVFFLAVKEEKRGRGYGTRILEKIRETNPHKIIALLIEDTEDVTAKNFDERIKRLEFYESNGFKRLNIKINEAGVAYELLGTDLNITQADFLFLMKNWLGIFLFKIIYRKTKFI